MDLKEEIKNSIKLSEVIGKNLSLKKRDNNNYVALCPFHREKTPSFNISVSYTHLTLPTNREV